MTDKRKNYGEQVGKFLACNDYSNIVKRDAMIKLVYYLIKQYGVDSHYDPDLYMKISNGDKVNNSGICWLSFSDVSSLLNSEDYESITEQQRLNRQNIMEA